MRMAPNPVIGKMNNIDNERFALGFGCNPENRTTVMTAACAVGVPWAGSLSLDVS